MVSVSIGILFSSVWRRRDAPLSAVRLDPPRAAGPESRRDIEGVLQKVIFNDKAVSQLEINRAGDIGGAPGRAGAQAERSECGRFIALRDHFARLESGHFEIAMHVIEEVSDRLLSPMETQPGKGVAALRRDGRQPIRGRLDRSVHQILDFGIEEAIDRRGISADYGIQIRTNELRAGLRRCVHDSLLIPFTPISLRPQASTRFPPRAV